MLLAATLQRYRTYPMMQSKLYLQTYAEEMTGIVWYNGMFDASRTDTNLLPAHEQRACRYKMKKYGGECN
jgi:hypothetical protein